LKPADPIPKALRDAIFKLFKQETEKMREAYLLQPDSANGVDTWLLPEVWDDERKD
jgi:hypothetical protein